MTRKKLVEVLTANFAEDEEVTFVYNDDQGEVRETRVHITEHTETHCIGHYELFELATGKWLPVSLDEFNKTKRGLVNKGRFLTLVNGFLKYKWVTDRPDLKDTKRVVYIG